ncbi:MAG: hypothetical protein U0163_21650 [Gemmatimonadaceae bacterium]
MVGTGRGFRRRPRLFSYNYSGLILRKHLSERPHFFVSCWQGCSVQRRQLVHKGDGVGSQTLLLIRTDATQG